MPLTTLFVAAALLPLSPIGRGLPAPEDRAAAKAETLSPRWDGNDIVAGSKRLSLQLNSRLALTEGGTTLFTMQYFGNAVSKATGKKLWIDPTYRFREGGGKMYRDGNAIVHERPFRLEDFSWDNAFRQRVELLPDGLVMIEAIWMEPEGDMFTFQTYGAKWTIPYERTKDGARFTVNGKAEDLPSAPGGNSGTWRIKPHEKFELSFFEEHAARQFRISTRPGETGGQGRGPAARLPRLSRFAPWRRGAGRRRRARRRGLPPRRESRNASDWHAQSARQPVVRARLVWPLQVGRRRRRVLPQALGSARVDRRRVRACARLTLAAHSRVGEERLRPPQPRHDWRNRASSDRGRSRATRAELLREGRQARRPPPRGVDRELLHWFAVRGDTWRNV